VSQAPALEAQIMRLTRLVFVRVSSWESKRWSTTRLLNNRA
jgi:hypothetical protein